jgi:hypothetical protein
VAGSASESHNAALERALGVLWIMYENAVANLGPTPLEVQHEMAPTDEGLKSSDGGSVERGGADGRLCRDMVPSRSGEASGEAAGNA